MVSRSFVASDAAAQPADKHDDHKGHDHSKDEKKAAKGVKVGDVAPGDYTVRVSYVGFPDFSVAVRVTSAPRVEVPPRALLGKSTI